ncbi:MAG TPA: glutathione-independent formaldehyde dehydrogenase, partial [Polyangia bacterium]
MKAIVYKGPRKVALENVADPTIESPGDCIVRITSTGICGSDLHMYEGRTSVAKGTVFGHENMGIVEEVGAAVVTIKKRDRVVVPFNVACGVCFNCTRGFTFACLTVNPEGFSGGYGYAQMGPYRGGQAEFLRVPFADVNCLKLPGRPGDEHEDDFVLLSDVFPTGYHATELAGVAPGTSVAVFGAGPVGLLAAYSALLRGAAEVYVVDQVRERLDKVRELGATPIDFAAGDPVEQIMELRRKNPAIAGAMRPGEAEKMPGVMSGIDAVGYQAHNEDDDEKPNLVLAQLIKLVNPTGRIGIVGVYTTEDPKGVDKHAKKGELQLPWGDLFEKGLTVGSGQTPVKRYNLFLRDLIIAGRARPSFIVSHRLP